MSNPANSARMSFITIATERRRPLFQVSRLAERFIEILLRSRSRGDLKLHAYLVMPDHVHLLLTPQRNSVEQVVHLLQQAFAHSLGTRRGLWEDGFTAHSVDSLGDLEVLRTYLHETPVRAHITSTAELYPYSSAHRY